MKALKYSYSALVFGILTFFSSCGSDDDSSPANLSLEGRVWTQISESVTNCTDETKNRSESYVCTAMECHTFFAEDDIVTFNNTERGMLIPETGTYTINGNEITIVFTTATTAAFSIVGDTLTVSRIDSDGCLFKAVYKAL